MTNGLFEVLYFYAPDLSLGPSPSLTLFLPPLVSLKYAIFYKTKPSLQL